MGLMSAQDQLLDDFQRVRSMLLHIFRKGRDGGSLACKRPEKIRSRSDKRVTQKKSDSVKTSALRCQMLA